MATGQSWEVEQKFRVQDAPALRDRLVSMGWVELRRIAQTDQYFRHPCRDFRQSGEAFRLRRDGDKCFVTYKGPRTDAAVKTRPEIELSLVAEQFDQWQELLQRLGFRPLPPLRKQRVVYRATTEKPAWGQVTVAVDDVEELGQFAEIEVVVNEPGSGTADGLARAQQLVREVAAALQLAEVEPRSYLTMAMEKWGLE